MIPASASNSEIDVIFFDLIEEYQALPQADRDLDAFARRHPQYADLILRDFPGVLMGDAIRSAIPIPVGESTFQPPSQLAGYEIEREIGRGGMGIVYLARQRSLERSAAIKVIPPELASRPRYRQRFAQEARTLSLLEHPNIVQIFDFGLEENFAWLAMQYIDGRVLSDGRHDSLLEADDKWKRIADIGAQVADALAHAHSRGIVHRDIKPGNLILSDNGRVRVTDFGLVKIAESELEISRTGDMVGTPRYMAPEQTRGVADDRSDLYSLGVTLWELCSGLRAWESGTFGRRKTIDDSGDKLIRLSEASPDVPDDLAAVIERACRSDARERYQTARDFHIALTQFAQGKEVVSIRAEPTVSSRRRLRLMLFAAVLLIVTMAFPAKSWWLRDATGRNSIMVLDVSQPVLIPENSAASGFLPVPEGVPSNDLAWALSGADSEFFRLNPRTGELLSDSLDYESPDDQDRDGIYDLEARYSSASTNAHGSLDFQVRLTDRNEPPVFRPKFGSRSLNPQGENGERGLPANIVFRADDPEGFGFHWRLRASDPRTELGPFGRVVIRAGFENCDLVADDSFAQRVIVFSRLVTPGDASIEGSAVLSLELTPNGSIRSNRRVKLPQSSRGVATAEGVRFYCIHRLDSSMALSIGSPGGVFELLVEDCGLPLDASGLATADGRSFYFSIGPLLHRASWNGTRFGDVVPLLSEGFGRSETRGFVGDQPNLMLHFSDEDGRLHLFRKPRRQTMVHTYNLVTDRAIGTESDLSIPTQGTLVGVCGWLEPQPMSDVKAGVAQVQVERRNDAIATD